MEPLLVRESSTHDTVVSRSFVCIDRISAPLSVTYFLPRFSVVEALTVCHDLKVNESDGAEHHEHQVEEQRQPWVGRHPVAQTVELLVRGSIYGGVFLHPAGRFMGHCHI